MVDLGPDLEKTVRTHDDEEDGEHGEAHELDGLAAPLVDHEEGRPVAGDEASSGEDHVAHGDVLQVLVHLVRAGEAGARRAETNGVEDNRRVETETVEGDVEREPRVRGTNEELEVLPLREVRHEVATGRLGGLDTLNDRIGVNVVGAGSEEVLDVLGRLLDVALDIHGEARGLGDGETEVEGDRAGNAAETDEETPHEVDVGEDLGVVVEEGGLVRLDDDESDKGGG